MAKIKELRDTQKKFNPGPKMQPPKVRNKGLEQAIAEAGSIDALARRIDRSPGAVRSVREKGMTDGVALAIWERCRIKLTKLLGRSITCPHCSEEI